MIRPKSKNVREVIVATLLCVGITIGCLAQTGNKGVKNKPLEQIAAGMQEYHSKYNRLPAAGSLAGGGMRFPAWQVELLPFINQEQLYSRIDRKQSWDSAANKAVFSTEVPTYLGNYDKQKKSADGLAVSHYAGNDHVFLPRRGVSYFDITDGTSNVLAVGEVGTDFSAWGRPDNTRNPACGLTGKSGQFGRKDGTGALFSLCDGSVRSLSSKVDPRILAALATVDGGDNFASLEEEARNAKAARGKKELAKSPEKTEEIDPREFDRAYSRHRRQAFELVTPADFRDDLLKTAFEASNDPKRKGTGIGFTKRDRFEFSNEIDKLANANIGQKRPLFAPDHSGNDVETARYFCMFAEETIATGPPAEFSFKLVKTSYEWTLNELIEGFLQNWSPDFLLVNTPDKKLPKLEMNADIVIIGNSSPADARWLTADKNPEMNALMVALEDYCAGGPGPLQKLRFRIVEREMCEVSLNPEHVIQKSRIKDKFANRADREAAYREICDKLGVNPKTSRVLDTSRCIDLVAAADLPTKPAEAEANQTTLRQFHETAQKEFEAKLNQASPNQFTDLRFSFNKKGFVEVYSD